MPTGSQDWQPLSQAKLEAEVAIMFLAGYETTGHTIAYALCVESAVYQHVLNYLTKRAEAVRLRTDGGDSASVLR